MFHIFHFLQSDMVFESVNPSFGAKLMLSQLWEKDSKVFPACWKQGYDTPKIARMNNLHTLNSLLNKFLGRIYVLVEMLASSQLIQ